MSNPASSAPAVEPIKVSVSKAAALGYLAGAAGAMVAAGVELQAPGKSFGLPGIASYTLVGGLAGLILQTGARLLAGRLGPLATAMGFLCVPVVVGLYAANVHTLPGEPFISPKSLAVDAAVLVVGLGLSLALMTSVSRASRWLERSSLRTSAFLLFAMAMAIVVPSSPWLKPFRGGDGGRRS